MSSQASRIRHAHETIGQVARFASGQKMLDNDGCSNHDDSNSKFEKYRMVENKRTMRIESVNAEPQRLKVKGSSARMAQSHAKNLETSKKVMT